MIKIQIQLHQLLNNLNPTFVTDLSRDVNSINITLGYPQDYASTKLMLQVKPGLVVCYLTKLKKKMNTKCEVTPLTLSFPEGIFRYFERWETCLQSQWIVHSDSTGCVKAVFGAEASEITIHFGKFWSHFYIFHPEFPTVLKVREKKKKREHFSSGNLSTK